ncbi:MAG: hypothetical protein RLZZ560_133, partial [Cyanobacteriota bacterium]
MASVGSPLMQRLERLGCTALLAVSAAA